MEKKRKSLTNNDSFNAKKAKKASSEKKKSKVEESSIKLEESFSRDEKVKVPKKKKKSKVKDEEEEEENRTLDQTEPSMVEDKKMMTVDELEKLISRILTTLPPVDAYSYKTRLLKLKWDDIAFDDFTADECQAEWTGIMHQQRLFRYLREIVDDALVYIKNPKFRHPGKTGKIHPDFPKRPLSNYMLFCRASKADLMKEHPGLKITDLSRMLSEMYRGLSNSERQKYDDMAQKKRAQYNKDVISFYEMHPDLKVIRLRKKRGNGPDRPLTPFQLYYQDRLRHDSNDPKTVKEECKENWSNLSDKDKGVWIKLASENEKKYLEELKKFENANPDVKVKATKPVITKEERKILSKICGKPDKPPMSAYQVFCRSFYKSKEVKALPSKERMKFVAQKWNDLSPAKKDHYKNKTSTMHVEYERSFNEYLSGLTPSERARELETKQIKKRTQPTKKFASSSNPINDIVKPRMWDTMDETERQRYLTTIQKIKEMFESHHLDSTKPIKVEERSVCEMEDEDIQNDEMEDDDENEDIDIENGDANASDDDEEEDVDTEENDDEDSD